MDFAPDETTERYARRLVAFMDEQVLPVRAGLRGAGRSRSAAGTLAPPAGGRGAPGRGPPAAGCGTCSCPASTAPGLTNLQYAPLAEITGRSHRISHPRR